MYSSLIPIIKFGPVGFTPDTWSSDGSGSLRNLYLRFRVRFGGCSLREGLQPGPLDTKFFETSI